MCSVRLPGSTVVSQTITLLNVPRSTGSVRNFFEFLAVRTIVGLIALLPGSLARRLGAWLGALIFHLHARLRSVGMRNLALALPELGVNEHQRILRRLFTYLGWHFAEFCCSSRFTPQNSASKIRYEGLEHFLRAQSAGKGVLILTGHLGAWELSSYYHSLMGHPMGLVARRLDNPLLESFVRSMRCRHGNWVITRDRFARGILEAMQEGRAVGILMDTNMTPPEGIFVDFFGIPACTASGLARIALRTGAAIVPGFLLWEAAESRYVLHFAPPIQPVITGDRAQDIVALTARCTAVLESWIRRYPDQWLWIHRRWKTRPTGEPSLYERDESRSIAGSGRPPVGDQQQMLDGINLHARQNGQNLATAETW